MRTKSKGRWLKKLYVANKRRVRMGSAKMSGNQGNAPVDNITGVYLTLNTISQIQMTASSGGMTVSNARGYTPGVANQTLLDSWAVGVSDIYSAR